MTTEHSKQAKDPKAVMGYRLPASRLTGWGYWYLLRYLGLPILLVSLLLDLVAYGLIRLSGGQCWALFCYLL